MNSFDIVMEKALDNRSKNRMTKSFQNIESINSSGIMREIKNDFEEAQKAKKNGDKVKARRLYSSCKKKLKDLEKSLDRNYDNITMSGNPKEKMKKDFISTGIAVIGLLIATIKLELTRFDDIKGIMQSLGIASGTALGYFIYQYFSNKKDEKNYSQVVKDLKNDPKSTYRELKYAIRTIDDQINVAMSNL